MKKSVLKIGIIGFGAMGYHHLKYLSSRNDIEVTCVADINKKRAEMANKDFGVRTFLDYKDMLNEKIDGVCISTLNNLHAEHIINSANAKKHIFCEKPLALNEKDGKKIVKAININKVKFMINFNLLFSPLTKKLLILYKNGEIGKMINCWCVHLRGYGFHSQGARHPAIIDTKTSGGWILHHAVHPLAWLCEAGGEVKNVFAKSSSTLKDKKIEESVFSIIEFKGNKTGTIVDSVGGIPVTQACISGEKGEAVLDENGTIRLKVKNKIKNIRIYKNEYDDFKEAWQQFINCVMRGEKPEVDIKKAYNILKIALAMKESIMSNKVITL